jgi:peptidoglycan/LPS O-acetylase OafA/YrhL
MRNHYLDSIRGLAILLVLFEHLGFSRYYSVQLPLGAIGVWIFFTLSGFLITSILIKKPSLKTFYIRRAIRLLPIYYLSILFIFIPFGLIPHDQLIYILTHTINFKQASDNSWAGGYASHFWSLSVEEQFYLIWPFVLIKIHENTVYYIMFALWLSCILFKIYCSLADLRLARYVLPVSCFDCLVIGSCLSMSKPSQKMASSLLLISLTSIVIILILSYYYKFTFLMTWLFPSSLSLLVCYLITQALLSQNRPNKLLKTIALLGTISYTLYIVHVPVNHLITPFLFNVSFFYQKIIILILCIALSSLSWKFIESPLVKIRPQYA